VTKKGRHVEPTTLLRNQDGTVENQSHGDFDGAKPRMPSLMSRANASASSGGSRGIVFHRSANALLVFADGSTGTNVATGRLRGG